MPAVVERVMRAFAPKHMLVASRVEQERRDAENKAVDLLQAYMNQLTERTPRPN
jgi:hypothetical protein